MASGGLAAVQSGGEGFTDIYEHSKHSTNEVMWFIMNSYVFGSHDNSEPAASLHGC